MQGNCCCGETFVRSVALDPDAAIRIGYLRSAVSTFKRGKGEILSIIGQLQIIGIVSCHRIAAACDRDLHGHRIAHTQDFAFCIRCEAYGIEGFRSAGL